MRRVLFDEDVPRQLRRDLPAFAIQTVQERGWSSLKNGELLAAASREFAAFVTADKNLEHQQHIPKFDLGVVVLAPRDTRLPSLRGLLPEIRDAIATVRPGEVIRVPRS